MSHRWWILASGLLLVAFGCNQSTVSNDDGDSKNISQAGCDDDDDCDTYFQCIDRLCSPPPAMTGDRDDETPVARFYDEDGDKLAQFYLELAITAEEQRQGLMYRPEMLDDWGMLFVYDREQHLSFWMKNTYISLDMIFVDDAGVVAGIVEEAEPETETPRGIGEPSRYVLEINGGLAAEHGIERGTEMSLDHVEDHVKPAR